MDVIYLRMQENEGLKEREKYLSELKKLAPPMTSFVVERASSLKEQVRLQSILRDHETKDIYCYSLHRLLTCQTSKVWGFLLKVYSLGKFIYFVREPPSGTIKSLLDAIAQYQKEHRAELDSLGHKLGRSSTSPDIDRIKALREIVDKKGHPTSWREIERLTGTKKSTAQRKLQEYFERKQEREAT